MTNLNRDFSVPTTEREVFKEWLEQNKQTLKNRTIDEIADMAITCGFSRLTVTPWQNSANFKAAFHG